MSSPERTAEHAQEDDPGPGTEEERTARPSVPPARRARSFLVYAAFSWLGLVVLAAALADVLPLAAYGTPVGAPRLTPRPGSLNLLLGTDQLGRSLLARCVYGARVSLLICALAGLLGAAVGAGLGMLAGYLQGRVDALIRLLADAMLAFPPLLLLLALSSVLTPSASTILIGLTLLVIPTFIRLARANTLSWAAQEFITAARNMGASDRRILWRELLPNLLPSLGAYLPVVMAALIVAEGSLSFLGMGIPPPSPSWGGMISDGKDSIGEYPHVVFVPTAFIFLTVFALNQAGDHLRHRFDRGLRD
ncbi:ABC transporter permease [Streptomyces sp. NBC_01239]|uniref:ABC transporter permease n=1 Tax=Streptomyces sp. NBC_01239 TaxID=2903792 RepID=UPI00224F7A4E|nr:ABC transporter permease [Streptomyces sp. NBC_01239]MCX4815239.1 ABC transporter permease [Streptomyces sp. NBC_01239]